MPFADHRPETAAQEVLQGLIDRSPQQQRLERVRESIQRSASRTYRERPAQPITPIPAMVIQRQPKKGKFEQGKATCGKFIDKKQSLRHRASAALWGIWHGRGISTRYQELNPPTEEDFAALRQLEKYLDQNLRVSTIRR